MDLNECIIWIFKSLKNMWFKEETWLWKKVFCAIVTLNDNKGKNI